jgi:hypothetical protein
MINFERHKDPKSSLSIGRIKERVFEDTDEAAAWFAKYPAAYTEGHIQDWGGKNPQSGIPFFDRAQGSFNSRALAGIPVSGKLQFIKWVKENIHFSAHPEAIIGLKEAKIIVDTAEQFVAHRLFSETHFPDQTDFQNMEEYIDTIWQDLRENPPDMHSPEYVKGYFDACNKMKTFIENIKRNETKSSRTRESQ